MGGMGPEASVDFLARVVAASNARCDQDHIRLILDHNPTIPNRHDAIAGRSPGIGPELAEMAKGLERAGADFLVMVCNTAHAWASEIQAAVAIPFVSIIDVTVAALPPPRDSGPVGVLAAQGCLQSGLYQEALQVAGYEPVLWDTAEQQRFMGLLYRIKSGAGGDDLQAAMRQLAAALTARGAGTLIAACTEIPLVLSEQDVPCPLLSSTDLLARQTVAIARNEISIEDTA